MEKLKSLLLNKRAKAFYWTTLNGFVCVLIIGLADINWIYAPILIALLNGLTKYINKEILSK